MKVKDSALGFPTLIQNFFCQRLINQQNVSTRTVAAYRDTFRLLLRYLEAHIKKSPSAITLGDLDAPAILAFLDYLEKERKNSIRTRNARLAAIRAFLKYAAAQNPTSLPIVQRVLAIPMKRFERPLPGFLSREEVEEIIKAPNSATWSGHRDQVMFATLYNTGARVSEITALRVADVSLKQTMSVNILGKGRKQRMVPLWKNTAGRIQDWLKRNNNGNPEAPLFPNSFGRHLTRSGVENRLKEAVKTASRKCPSLNDRKISPHTIRHATALHLLQSGVDLTVIALWLGHETPSTTHMYMEADIMMKEKVLNKFQAPHNRPFRFKASDDLLQFLEGL